MPAKNSPLSRDQENQQKVLRSAVEQLDPAPDHEEMLVMSKSFPTTGWRVGMVPVVAEKARIIKVRVSTSWLRPVEYVNLPLLNFRSFRVPGCGRTTIFDWLLLRQWFRRVATSRIKDAKAAVFSICN